jgi:hypothetical protein
MWKNEGQIQTDDHHISGACVVSIIREVVLNRALINCGIKFWFQASSVTLIIFSLFECNDL